ncbi:hypothetical protein CUMW_031430 [Citrus unshiu]|nr:hypothetical protein CUMW_031430 [Citrus unshiu]
MIPEKCRIKVMKIIAKANGVTSIVIQGPNKDRVMVIGDGVDPFKMTTALRNKVGNASLESAQKMNNKNYGGSGYPQRPVYYKMIHDHPYWN